MGLVLDVPEEDLQAVYQKALMQPGVKYDGKKFTRPMLRPAYKALFDLIHKVFLGYPGNNDAVTPAKFRVMTAIVQKLDVNWARFLLELLNEEVKQLDIKVDENDKLLEFKIARNFRLSTKIYSLILGLHQDHLWEGMTPFHKDKVPKDKKQLEQMIGVDLSVMAKYDDSVKSFLYEMGRTNPAWVPPEKKRQRGQGKQNDRPHKTLRIRSPTPAPRRLQTEFANIDVQNQPVRRSFSLRDEIAEEEASTALADPSSQVSLPPPSVSGILQVPVLQLTNQSLMETQQTENPPQQDEETESDEEFTDTALVVHQFGESSHQHQPRTSSTECVINLLLSSDDEEIQDPEKEAASMLVNTIVMLAEKKVLESLPGIELTPETK